MVIIALHVVYGEWDMVIIFRIVMFIFLRYEYEICIMGSASQKEGHHKTYLGYVLMINILALIKYFMINLIWSISLDLFVFALLSISAPQCINLKSQRIDANITSVCQNPLNIKIHKKIKNTKWREVIWELENYSLIFLTLFHRLLIFVFF